MVAPEVLFIGAPIKNDDTVGKLINEDTKTGEEESNYDDSKADNNLSNPPKTMLRLDIKKSNVDEDSLEENASNVCLLFTLYSLSR